MEQGLILQKRKLTWGLLFVGFCCAFGWLATNFILLTHFTNSRNLADITAFTGTVLMGFVCTSFYAVIGAISLIWAVRRLKHTEPKKHLIKASLIPAAILTPILGIGGIAIIMLAPFVYGHVKAFVAGPNIVQSADSPDGKYRAYVVDKPSIDGPNHHLYVKDIETQESAFVVNLPEDVDFNKEIHWSPFSDIVAFRTHFKLIVYSYKNGKNEEVVLGGERHWRKNGTFWVDYEDVKTPYNMQFPEPGRFTCQLEGSEETFTAILTE